MGKQGIIWSNEDYATCESCGCLYVPKSATVISRPLHGFNICLHCRSRRRTAMVYPLYFVRTLIALPCENGVMGPADKCRCVPCAARHIWHLYRKELFK